jgi:hypothetical protein
MRNLKVLIHWVPAHTDIAGNEAVDKAAKEAAHRKTRRGDPISTITVLPGLRRIRTAISSLTLQRTNQEWIDRWTTGNTGRALFKFFREFSTTTGNLPAHMFSSKYLSAIMV